MLLHNYIFSVVIKVEEVPYCPGWNRKRFMYNTDNPMLANTPFLNKKLTVNRDITQKRAFDILVEKICMLQRK